jgi:hypothetical protein
MYAYSKYLLIKNLASGFYNLPSCSPKREKVKNCKTVFATTLAPQPADLIRSELKQQESFWKEQLEKERENLKSAAEKLDKARTDLQVQGPISQISISAEKKYQIIFRLQILDKLPTKNRIHTYLGK